MLIEQVVYDVKTGETNIEYIEVSDILEEGVVKEPTIEDKIIELERVNAIQDELINVSLLATDEMFCMLEPLLSSVNIIDVKGVSKMVDMYVAMVQRGIKQKEDIPLRYREEVIKILEALEK